MAMSVVYTTINGRLIQQVKGGQVTKFVSDTLGSVVAEVDDTGQVTHTADYWPYGELRTETGTKQSSFGFVGVLGYMKDFADALYVRARYLRTKLARWHTVDPLWPYESAYQYCDGQPPILTDHAGLKPKLEFHGCNKDQQRSITYLFDFISPIDHKVLHDCLEKCARAGDVGPNQGMLLEECIDEILHGRKLLKITCRKSNSGKCKGACAHTHMTLRPPLITICDLFWDVKRCGWPGQCTLLHEALHVCGLEHPKENGYETDPFNCVKEIKACKNMGDH